MTSSMCWSPMPASWGPADDEGLQLDKLIDDLAQLQADEGVAEEAQEQTLDSVLAQVEEGFARHKTLQNFHSPATRIVSAPSWDLSRTIRAGFSCNSEQQSASNIPKRRPSGPSRSRRVSDPTPQHPAVHRSSRPSGASRRKIESYGNMTEIRCDRSQSTEPSSHLQAERERMRAARQAVDPQRKLRAEREKMRAAWRARLTVREIQTADT